MVRKKSLRNLIIIVLALAVITFILQKKGAINIENQSSRYFVSRVIDGDTILLANKERIRYVGINTPETNHPSKPVEWMGKEAKEYNRGLVEHKWVYLEFDIELRDKYGRLLAYVFVDDTFVNAELVKQGYAQVLTIPPNVKHTGLFLDLEREARAAKRGLWSKE